MQRYVADFGEPQQATGGETVAGALIFLNLLERHPELCPESFLADAPALTYPAEPRAHMPVDAAQLGANIVAVWHGVPLF